MSYNIPMIDFAKCGLLAEESDVTEQDLRNSGDELYSALSTAGFAYLTNHGISWDIIDRLNEVAEKFYSLPMDTKKEFSAKSFILAYDAIGKSKANLKEIDYYEGFRVSSDGFTNEAIRWPDVPGLRETYVEFATISHKLLMRMMKALGYGMKLKDVDYFCKAHAGVMQKGNYSAVKTIKYPPITEDAETHNRIGEHTDKDTMTLLFQDEMGGLQVRNMSGDLVDVQPVSGAIVINVGDTMAAWSGNRLKATSHRVATPPNPNNRGKVRRSLGYFGQADGHVLMEKLVFEDGVEDKQEETGEKPMTVEEHFAKYLGDIFSYND